MEAMSTALTVAGDEEVGSVNNCKHLLQIKPGHYITSDIQPLILLANNFSHKMSLL